MSGELLDRFTVGALDVRVTRSCARRDLYDVRAPGALPLALRSAMVARAEGATLAGNDLLWVIDVPHVHRITVSAASGRIAVLPRMETERPDQRAAVMALCEWLEGALTA
ncbi:hypothetical protein [Sandaracinus amylolyticus]|uniref:Uncharacterized protein n=1 Tax=Sandaracinus amylolyticus TaxID=927083 RepID=A0A0F6YMB0_9BACT|nr:hypothetical protein [Sandaracinus amylolyticus]AKF10803.1 hypothetical protein DB32_007952 [Sandaracinus amylolyticus]